MTTTAVGSVRRSVQMQLVVSDAPARPVPYGKTGAMYLPDALHVEWVRRGDGGWRVLSLSISGHIKKGGALSEARITERFWSWVGGWPEWVVAAVVAQDPWGSKVTA
jgi:hypothetical protein